MRTTTDALRCGVNDEITMHYDRDEPARLPLSPEGSPAASLDRWGAMGRRFDGWSLAGMLPIEPRCFSLREVALDSYFWQGSPSIGAQRPPPQSESWEKLVE